MGGVDTGGEQVEIAVQIVVAPGAAASPVVLVDAKDGADVGEAHRGRFDHRRELDPVFLGQVARIGAVAGQVGQAQIPLAHLQTPTPLALLLGRGGSRKRVDGLLVRLYGAFVLAQPVAGSAQQQADVRIAGIFIEQSGDFRDPLLQLPQAQAGSGGAFAGPAIVGFERQDGFVLRQGAFGVGRRDYHPQFSEHHAGGDVARVIDDDLLEHLPSALLVRGLGRNGRKQVVAPFQIGLG